MKIIEKFLKYTAIFVLSLMTYLLIVNLLSFVSVNEDSAENNQEIPIYILTNGVHTDVVLPLKNEHYDWTNQLKPEHTKAKDSTYQYAALGWGDKGFYLETPTWADLKTSTALKAALGFSTTAMHVTFYKDLKENKSCKKIQISLENYQNLIAFINESFQTKSRDFLKIETEAVYGKHDVFYEANGSYSLFYTCNSWANQALKAANQKAALWTISDSGIFRHYE